jgi:hypothetical protein
MFVESFVPIVTFELNPPEDCKYEISVNSIWTKSYRHLIDLCSSFLELAFLEKFASLFFELLLPEQIYPMMLE